MGNIYKEWDEKLDKLRELLRIEFLLRNSMDAPWHCVEGDCPYLGKPMVKNRCKCFDDKCHAHLIDVKAELKL
jgi:hypothetical protein